MRILMVIKTTSHVKKQLRKRSFNFNWFSESQAAPFTHWQYSYGRRPHLLRYSKTQIQLETEFINYCFDYTRREKIHGNLFNCPTTSLSVDT